MQFGSRCNNFKPFCINCSVPGVRALHQAFDNGKPVSNTRAITWIHTDTHAQRKHTHKQLHHGDWHPPKRLKTNELQSVAMLPPPLPDTRGLKCTCTNLHKHMYTTHTHTQRIPPGVKRRKVEKCTQVLLSGKGNWLLSVWGVRGLVEYVPCET